MQPLGTLHVAAALKDFFKNEIEISFVKGLVDINDNSIVNKVLSTDPDYIGISTTTIYSDRLLNLAKKIHSHKPSKVIFAGGFRITQYGKDLIENEELRFFILGDGETPTVQAIKNLELNQSIDNIPGVMTKTNPNPIFNEEDISKLPSPWLTRVVEYDPIYNSSYWELERGCAFNCTYCYLTRYKREPSQIPLDRVEKELRYITEFHKNLSQLYISNPTFTTDIQRANYLFDMFYKIAPSMKWDISLRPEHITDELIMKMSKFKKINLQIGLQSFVPSVLKDMHRAPIDKEQYTKMFHKLQNRKIPFTVDLIIGYPGETIESFKEGVKYLVDIGVRSIISYRLQIYPETEIGRNAEKLGLKYYPGNVNNDAHCFKPYIWSQERGEIQPFRIYETSTITKEELAEASVWAQEYIKEHPVFL
jgi:radical SAM superfamily enzyme YgiQ (UPF0313 family)